jgi:hypothetical protein
MKKSYTENPTGHKVKFHALLADRSGCPEHRLWAYIRRSDAAGSGWAVIAMDEVRAALNCGQSTVYRWLKAGMATFFRHYQHIAPGIFIVYYRSAKVAFQKSGLGAVGAIGYVDAEVLSSRNACKIVSTEMQIATLQNQAHYAARRGNPVAVKQGKIIKAEDILRSEPSHYSRGVTVEKGFLTLEPDAPICPHTTLRSISLSLGRGISTIQRRISDQWREKNDFEPLPKLRTIRFLNPFQVENCQYNIDRAFHTSEIDSDWIKVQERLEEEEGRKKHWYDRKKRRQQPMSQFFINPKSSSTQLVVKFSRFSDRLAFLGGNIYDCSVGVTGLRHDRRAIKASLGG